MAVNANFGDVRGDVFGVVAAVWGELAVPEEEEVGELQDQVEDGDGGGMVAVDAKRENSRWGSGGAVGIYMIPGRGWGNYEGVEAMQPPSCSAEYPGLWKKQRILLLN